MRFTSRLLVIGLTGLSCLSLRAADFELPIITNVDWQPLAAQVRRLIESSEYLGTPFAEADKAALQTALDSSDARASIQKVQEILDHYCLFSVHINPEMRVKVAQGPARPELVEQGWRQFLVKVQNESGTTATMMAVSHNAEAVSNVNSAQTTSDKFFRNPKKEFTGAALRDRWLDMQAYNKPPQTRALNGLAVEYRILQLYSRDVGKREAKIGFNVGQGTQDIGFRNEVDILFDCLPARDVTLNVLDENNQPTTASFTFRDNAGRVYPSQAKRLAPDFAFHPQVYRADGEKLKLPDGNYSVEFERGPESIKQTRNVTVDANTKTLAFKVERWIDPSKDGWWSGDHHIHAAGCAHYTNPTEGVFAPDMARHCRGEDLKIGANLTWGPCFDFQKKFFTGTIDKASEYPYLLRYDIEVSGFGSHKSGHLCLLRLKDQMYPGGDSDDHWPTLCLNTLKWAKKQGALVGPAHTGWGLQVEGNQLPNYNLPKFDGIGANEYIVDVTHLVDGPDGKLVPAVDFLSMVDTPAVWELNIWYHTLNAGFRTRISGETDFPCIYGERVGLGRSYVKLDGRLDYNDWCEAIRVGRNYVSDGKSHLLDFKVNDVRMGENKSELKLPEPAPVKISARVAAMLPEEINPRFATLGNATPPYGSGEDKPFWTVERARIGQTRQVSVELIVNGVAVAKKPIEADGKMQDIAFDARIDRSSWVALRILPSSHTNPIWVKIADKPVREKRSIEWCLKGVDQCWSQKEKVIAKAEMEDAKAAYDYAREIYRQRLNEAAQ